MNDLSSEGEGRKKKRRASLEGIEKF